MTLDTTKTHISVFRFRLEGLHEGGEAKRKKNFQKYIQVIIDGCIHSSFP
jgi:hypothetical protein